jgi:hypothetical protein
MFLPFLLALASCACLAVPRLRPPLRWRERCSHALWLATVIVTIAWFFHHATDPLNFSF